LKKNLVDKMREVQLDLASLPKSFADDPQAHLLSLCTGFVEDMDFYTNGKENSDPKKPTFLHDALPHYSKLKDKVSHTRPKFEIAPAISLGPPICVTPQPDYQRLVVVGLPNPDDVYEAPIAATPQPPRAQPEISGTSSQAIHD
jgi:hypothetical protein